MLQRDLNALTARYSNGWQIKLGNATFSGNSIKFKMEVFDTSGGLSPGQDEFNRQCRVYGLEPVDFGREFRYGGKTFKLSGVIPRGRKFVLQGRNVSDGRTYKFRIDVVNILHPGRINREYGSWTVNRNPQPAAIPACLVGVGDDGEL
jgi:hypothetical protein